ncbi:aminotransferase class V-fold PLP-dependent enzyme [Pseudooceanicola nanhaiensis]|uniref:aminotransferase class V-fold PLP-dependent enzyme n=1 Tax=Pseudooceanicola nanhaiensis TaxID=375761 RepID=UPI001CD2FC4A|nr:aminotransferase class V-fold PLP-dependent enzyme [Pseudooceanicola nanhaiensis]MCA0922870.1 aminotransferase class V-fold PLP-dependent enzyme [Pseudooceanicola nanhaiensis]
MIDIAQVRRDTPGAETTTHLLACGSSLMPRCVADAVIKHTRLEAQIGGYEAHAQQAAPLEGVYASVARHIGARPREIALMENATVAWCHAFYALPLRKGARVLTCEAEYAANYVAFLQRAKRDGIIIEVIPSDADGALDVEALEHRMGDDVGLIAITWIPTNGGLVNPAAEVGRIARAHGVPYLLDGCQAAGQMRIDVAELGCDFFSATGRKYLRGPRGTGFLYVAERWLDHLEPAMIDHFGAPWVERDRYELRDDARRFETWENSYALRAGLGAAIDYADRIGIEAIEARVRLLADHARSLLAATRGVQLRDLGRERCGIVSVSVDHPEPQSLVARMAEAGFVIGTSAPSSTRLDAERRGLPTLLRLAPHYFNTEDELDRAVAHLGTLL